jgi:chemotaxis protein MotB
MITLLVAFFIMLYSMSVMNQSKFRRLAISIKSGFGGSLEGGGHSPLNPSPGMAGKPGILPELDMADASNIKHELKEYISNKKLQNELRLTDTERGLVVSIVTDKMLFPKGEADVKPQAAQLLEEVSSLIQNTKSHVRVEGHTDSLPISTPKYPSNWELSTARAVVVVRYLIEHCGMDPRRISAAGFADSRPLVPNDTEAHRAYNRRVDIVIVKTDESPPD